MLPEATCEPIHREILQRLGLELHPDKTRRAELFDGKEGFDFLGCHLHKRMSGTLWEKKGKRLYFLHRWPSRRAMNRVRQRIRELTPRGRRHADLREVIAATVPSAKVPLSARATESLPACEVWMDFMT